MAQPRFRERLANLFGWGLQLLPKRGQDAQTPAPRSHVIIIDGTQSQLADGSETNAGLMYKLLQETQDPDQTTLWYHPGIQGHGFWNWVTIASGWGINQVIFDAYAELARNYQAGDRIYLFGFSRGAYAVRSVAGMIAHVGLVRATSANRQTLRTAFRLYEHIQSPQAVAAFQSIHCHPTPEIEMIGAWDTVKALGISYPVLSYLAPMATEFHNTEVTQPIKSAYHALALDENRNAFAPVLWTTPEGWNGHLEQVWFSGAHSDVGGHVWSFPSARLLSNIPLNWMLEKAESHGLKLPNDWRDRFPVDPNAEPVGSRRGIGKFFLLRHPRVFGAHPSETLHETAKIEGSPTVTAGCDAP